MDEVKFDANQHCDECGQWSTLGVSVCWINGEIEAPLTQRRTYAQYH